MYHIILPGILASLGSAFYHVGGKGMDILFIIWLSCVCTAALTGMTMLNVRLVRYLMYECRPQAGMFFLALLITLDRGGAILLRFI